MMLTYAPGTMEDERDMHARFRECHERGEYFRPVGGDLPLPAGDTPARGCLTTGHGVTKIDHENPEYWVNTRSAPASRWGLHAWGLACLSRAASAVSPWFAGEAC